MSEFERLEQLLAEVEIASTQAAHRIRVERCRKEFASIRVDAHAVAHEICDARESYRTILVECSEEGKRLGAWAAQLRAKNADMEMRRLHLVLTDATVKALWDQATAILRHEAEAYMAASEAREAHKTYGEKMLDKATIDMRLGRADIVERVEDLRSWLHSEEEMRRRNDVKWALRQEIEAKEEADKVEIKLAQESLQEDLEWLQFGEQVVVYMAAIAENLGKIMPSLTAESKAIEKKMAFATRMKEAKLAKRAKKEAEEAELQRLIEEEAAAKLAEENKVNAANFLMLVDRAETLDEATAYILAAKNLDPTINAPELNKMAAAKLAKKNIVVAKKANEAVEECHVKRIRFKKGQRPQDDCGYQMVGKKVVGYETVEA